VRNLALLLALALVASGCPDDAGSTDTDTVVGDTVVDDTAGDDADDTAVPEDSTTEDSGTEDAADASDTAEDAACGPDELVDGAFPEPGPIADLTGSFIDLNHGWRFHTDPDGGGEAAGWATAGFDDGAWETLSATATWEDQGHGGYDGYGWYRHDVDIPADWDGDAVILESNGVDDAYDLWVNGTWVAHHGDAPDASVWNLTTKDRIEAQLVAGQVNVLAVRVDDWAGGGGIWRKTLLRRVLPLSPYEELLPKPVLDGEPELVDLYWRAWGMAWAKIGRGTADNGFAPLYLDEGFNEQIYQWDSSFICLFARYGARLLPVMATLDDFYAKQREDGYIQRVYSETTGGELDEPTSDEPMVNPPLFAWVEWEYARFTGDTSRLSTVLPHLTAYDAWLDEHLRTDVGKGLYYQTELGSGMDNTPRGDSWKSAWVDMSLQQVLAARMIARIAAAAGDATAASAWEAKATARAGLVDSLLWDENDGWYYDMKVNGEHTGIRHGGAFWAFLAEVASPEQADRVAGHMANPEEFWRAHPFPTLSARDPLYDGSGHYWRGGVWAPTNYAAIRGLAQAGHHELAHDAALAHVRMMRAVYDAPPSDPGATVAPQERDGDYATLWECYAPDATTPCTRWDATYFGRQDFVGWSGLGPIALLIEEIIGLDVDALDGRITWRIRRSDRHGIERLPFGAGHQVALVADARGDGANEVVVQVSTTRGFTLEVAGDVAPGSYEVCPGTTELRLPLATR